MQQPVWHCVWWTGWRGLESVLASWKRTVRTSVWWRAFSSFIVLFGNPTFVKRNELNRIVKTAGKIIDHQQRRWCRKRLVYPNYSKRQYKVERSVLLMGCVLFFLILRTYLHFPRCMWTIKLFCSIIAKYDPGEETNTGMRLSIWRFFVRQILAVSLEEHLKAN